MRCSKICFIMEPSLKERGFTLIELIIVAAIIIVLVAVSSPLFKTTFSDIEVKNSIYDIGKIIRYAQERAIVEEHKYKLACDFEERYCRLFSEVEGSKKEDRSEESEDEGDSTSWIEAFGRFDRRYYLPKGAKFQGEGNAIIFYPGGRCEKVTILVNDGDKKLYEITTNGRAGYVKIGEVRDDE